MAAGGDVFTVLITSPSGDTWEWLVPLDGAQAAWELLGQPDRVVIVGQPAGHGRLREEPT